MKRFASFIVALAFVFSLTPALQITFAESKVRDNSGNIPATMLFNRWFRVGQDRDGVLLNPSTLDPADVVAKDAGGKGYRLFPWQKEGQEVWGRPSVNNDYAMPRLIPTQGWSALGRDEAGNRDFNNNYAINQYAWWTEIFLTVKPNAGESQMYAHWYAIIDTNGELWLAILILPLTQCSTFRRHRLIKKAHVSTIQKAPEILFQPIIHKDHTILTNSEEIFPRKLISGGSMILLETWLTECGELAGAIWPTMTQFRTMIIHGMNRMSQIHTNTQTQ